MKKKLVIAFIFLVATTFSSAQLVDRYGINAGTTYSNMDWDYKNPNIYLVEKDHKLGIQAFFYVEKDLINFLALKSEIGYIQKGFKDNVDLTSPEGEIVGTIAGNFITHDLALNFGFKIKPLKTKFSPYLFAGLRGDYTFAYTNVKFKVPATGEIIKLYDSETKEFNKFNFGGLISLGADINDLIYFEIEYNPSFTNVYKNAWLTIKDYPCWGAKIGISIGKLTQ